MSKRTLCVFWPTSYSSRFGADARVPQPPKKEYVLYAPLTVKQKELYQAVMDGALREWLISAKSGADKAPAVAAPAPAPTDEGRKLRKKGKVDYDQESDDDEYLTKLAAGQKGNKDHEKAQAAVTEALRKNTGAFSTNILSPPMAECW